MQVVPPVDVVLLPLEVLEVLDPLEKGDRDASAIGVDICTDSTIVSFGSRGRAEQS